MGSLPSVLPGKPLIGYTPIQNESFKKKKTNKKENNYGCKDKIYSYRQYVEHVLESVILSMGASEPYENFLRSVSLHRIFPKCAQN